MSTTLGILFVLSPAFSSPSSSVLHSLLFSPQLEKEEEGEATKAECLLLLRRRLRAHESPSPPEEAEEGSGLA